MADLEWEARNSGKLACLSQLFSYGSTCSSSDVAGDTDSDSPASVLCPCDEQKVRLTASESGRDSGNDNSYTVRRAESKNKNISNNCRIHQVRRAHSRSSNSSDNVYMSRSTRSKSSNSFDSKKRSKTTNNKHRSTRMRSSSSNSSSNNKHRSRRSRSTSGSSNSSSNTHKSGRALSRNCISQNCSSKRTVIPDGKINKNTVNNNKNLSKQYRHSDKRLIAARAVSSDSSTSVSCSSDSDSSSTSSSSSTSDSSDSSSSDSSSSSSSDNSSSDSSSSSCGSESVSDNSDQVSVSSWSRSRPSHQATHHNEKGTMKRENAGYETGIWKKPRIDTAEERVSVERLLGQKESDEVPSFSREDVMKEGAGMEGEHVLLYEALFFGEENKAGKDLKAEPVKDRCVKNLSGSPPPGSADALCVAEECDDPPAGAGDVEALCKVQLPGRRPESVTICCSALTHDTNVQYKGDTNTPYNCESTKQNNERQPASPKEGCTDENICSVEQTSKSPRSDISDGTTYNNVNETNVFSEPESKQSQSALLTSDKQCDNASEIDSAKSRCSSTESFEDNLKPTKLIAVRSAEQFVADREKNEGTVGNSNRFNSDMSTEMRAEKDLLDSSKKSSYFSNLCDESQGRDGTKPSSISERTPVERLRRDLKHHSPSERDLENSPRSSAKNGDRSRRVSRKKICRHSQSPERKRDKYRSRRSSEKDGQHDHEPRRDSCEKSPKSPEGVRRYGRRPSGSRDRCTKEWKRAEGNRDDSGSVKRDRSFSQTRRTDSHRSEGYHRADVQQPELAQSRGREDRYRHGDHERNRSRRHNADKRHNRTLRFSYDDDRYSHQGRYDRYCTRSSSQHKRSRSRGYLCEVSTDGEPRVWSQVTGPSHSPVSGPSQSENSTNLSEVPRWSQATGRSKVAGQSADGPCVHPSSSEPLPPGLDGDRQPAGYCFVEFSDPAAARLAMLRLNSKTVPNSEPPKRFKLNLASFRNEHLLVPEFSLFVGELSEDVDDYTLYSAFSARYKSCYAVKVLLSNEGRSRGFGFVRFTNETDQQRALLEMQNYTGIGQKPIKVSMATPKGRLNRGTASSQYNWSQAYQQQQQQQQWWQAYQQPASFYYSQDATANMDAYAAQSANSMDDYSQTGHMEDEVLEDPNLDVDIDKMNKEFMEQSEELYMALEGSRWHPLDNVMSPITVNMK